MKYKLVLIVWRDSHSHNGWRSLEDITAAVDEVFCRSVGWLVADRKKTKVLVSSLSGEGNKHLRTFGAGEIAIPHSAIVRMKVLSG